MTIEQIPNPKSSRSPQQRIGQLEAAGDPFAELLAYRLQFKTRVEPFLRTQEETSGLVRILSIACDWLIRNSTEEYLTRHPTLEAHLRSPFLEKAIKPLLPAGAASGDSSKEDDLPSLYSSNGEEHQPVNHLNLAQKAISLDPILWRAIKPLLPAGAASGDSSKEDDLPESFQYWIGDSLYNIVQARRSGTFTTLQTTEGRRVFMPLEAALNGLAVKLLEIPAFVSLKKSLVDKYKIGTDIGVPCLEIITQSSRPMAVAEDVALSIPELGIHVSRRWVQQQKQAGYIETPGIEAIINEILDDNRDGKVAGTVIMGGIGSGKTRMGIRLSEREGREVGVISCHEFLGYDELIGQVPVYIKGIGQEEVSRYNRYQILTTMNAQDWWQGVKDLVAWLKQNKQLDDDVSTEEFILPYCLSKPDQQSNSAEDFYKAYLRMQRLILMASDLKVYIDGREETLGKEGGLVFGYILSFWNRGIQPFLDEIEKAGKRSLHGFYYLLGLSQGDAIHIGGYSFTIPSWAKIRASSNLKDVSDIPEHQRPLFDRMKRKVLPPLPDPADLILMATVWLADREGNILLNQNEQVQLVDIILHSFSLLRQAYETGTMVQPFTLRGLEDMCNRLVRQQDGLSFRTQHSVIGAFEGALRTRPYLPEEIERQADNPITKLLQLVKARVIDKEPKKVLQPWTKLIVSCQERVEAKVTDIKDALQANGYQTEQLLDAHRPIPAKGPNQDYFTQVARRMLRREDAALTVEEMMRSPLYHAVRLALDADVPDMAQPTAIYEVDEALVDWDILTDAAKRVIEAEEGARGGTLNLPLGTRVSISRSPRDSSFNVNYGIAQPAALGEKGGTFRLFSQSSEKLGFVGGSQIDRDATIGLVAASLDGQTIVFEIGKSTRHQLVVIDQVFGDSPKKHPPLENYHLVGLSEDGLKLYLVGGNQKEGWKVRESIRQNRERVSVDSKEGVICDGPQAAILTNSGQMLVVADEDKINFYDLADSGTSFSINKPDLAREARQRLIPIGKHTVVLAQVDNQGSLVKVVKAYFISS